MNEITTILNEFLIQTKSTSALISGTKGKLISSLHLDYSDSVAAMSDAILSMSDKFLTDLDKGLLKQLYLKTTDGVAVINKINNSHSVIVFSNDGSNLGLFLRNIDELSTQLSKINLLK
ncbi:roadblock/LC7 domain-containing protein [Flavobacterium sp. LS1R49]|uniref:Roadblock/LC7 domain-containing protein n=1 Tax=Flavobacterium shii TaxID=2987687 RepID=A0A9X3BXU5_9FLAO|nr:roadblock/LC7 domain-containing protein [Flavobacterium shii]MCV9927790.1 roadblock/LC7 domain-containing protein [Flavobacterium shii]